MEHYNPNAQQQKKLVIRHQSKKNWRYIALPYHFQIVIIQVEACRP